MLVRINDKDLKMGNTKRAVVFAGDYAYIRQIETAMKSICRHNSRLKNLCTKQGHSSRMVQ